MRFNKCFVIMFPSLQKVVLSPFQSIPPPPKANYCSDSYKCEKYPTSFPSHNVSEIYLHVCHVSVAFKTKQQNSVSLYDWHNLFIYSLVEGYLRFFICWAIANKGACKHRILFCCINVIISIPFNFCLNEELRDLTELASVFTQSEWEEYPCSTAPVD